MTEVKRVPYRITHNEEGDMFEDFSCSSDFEKICAGSQVNQAKVGHGLLFGGRQGRGGLEDEGQDIEAQQISALNLNIQNTYQPSKTRQ